MVTTIENVTFTGNQQVLTWGSLQVTAEEQHNVPIPTIAGVIAVIAGLGMIFASRRSL